ncbi:hypothetical protein LPN01_14250 [Sphingomonas sp. A2-49]|uniref:hypothetical protein n=1 Tax=Sphingomonas sp. A2-49 TaxID=1391375 RepID=UPI0021D3C3B4|nr:hypothetical protein [Sphingomonas sp. A2-49]MCU6455244.1 hypothetical protein [Sphingomonas sp. A2-49]
MIVSLLSLLLAAVPQASATPSPAVPKADKPVCRREVPTGSTLQQRVCHSRAEWAAIDAANAGSVDAMQGARRGSLPRN